MERIVYDLPLFSRVWDRSGSSGPWGDVGVLLSSPPSYIILVYLKLSTVVWCVCFQHCSSRTDSFMSLSLPGRVLKALAEAGVPVPPVLALCEDKR